MAELELIPSLSLDAKVRNEASLSVKLAKDESEQLQRAAVLNILGDE